MQALFQWNDLNYDVDLFFLHCRYVDFVTSSCRFQAPQTLCWGTGSPSSRLLLLFFRPFFFFSDRPTQNQKTYSTVNEKKKGMAQDCRSLVAGEEVTVSIAIRQSPMLTTVYKRNNFIVKHVAFTFNVQKLNFTPSNKAVTKLLQPWILLHKISSELYCPWLWSLNDHQMCRK